MCVKLNLFYQKLKNKDENKTNTGRMISLNYEQKYECNY